MKLTLSALPTRLGRGSSAAGRLTGSGTLEIHGHLTAELDWAGGLTVGAEGRFEGDGRVHRLELRGILDGRLDVRDEAVVRRGARWSGAGRAPVMTTEAGAWLEGEFLVRPAESGP